MPIAPPLAPNLASMGLFPLDLGLLIWAAREAWRHGGTLTGSGGAALEQSGPSTAAAQPGESTVLGDQAARMQTRAGT